MYRKAKNKSDHLSSLIERIGKKRNPKDIPTLIELLWGGDKETVNNAAWALTQMSDPLAVEAIVYRADFDSGIDLEFLAPLLREMGDIAMKPLVEALQCDSPRVRHAAAFYLGELGSEEAIASLESALKDEWGYVSHAAAKSLERVRASSASIQE